MRTRIAAFSAGLTLLSASCALAAPAYVKSTVNLRAAVGTTSEIVTKIPAGSLVDAANCAEWCEVEWQGKKGFAIATALDTSGRVPSAPVRPRTRTADVTGTVPVVTGPPVVMYGPPVYYPAPYPYAYGYYGPRRYYGYRRWRW